MKFNYNILAISLFGAMAVACDPMEDIYDEIDAEETVITKSEDEYVMTKADYEAIAKAALKDATTKNDSNWANKVKSEQALNDVVPAADYVPGLIAKLYPTWGKGSTVGVTFNFHEEVDSVTESYSGAKYVKVSGDDYAAIWAKDGFNPGFLSPKHKPSYELPRLLSKKFPNVEKGAYAVVDYFYDDVNPSVSLLNEKFSGAKVDKDIWVKGWKQILVNGSIKWVGKEYSGDSYAQISAFGADGAVETALVTSTVTVPTTNVAISFDTKYGHYNGKCFSIYMSEKYAGEDKFVEADWTDITDKFAFPTDTASKYTKQVNSGKYLLDEFVGKKLTFAFVYRGAKGGVTTTVQLDNVKVADVNAVESTEKPYTEMYSFDGKYWNAYHNDDVVCLTPEDYDAMGAPGSHKNFSNSIHAGDYLPQFLAGKFTYAQERDMKVVLYKYYVDKGDTKYTTVYADRYDFKGGVWAYNNYIVTHEKEAFLHNGEKWLYDPTIRISVSEADYLFLTTWANENKPQYVDAKHSDSEYWFGASVHYKNFNVQLIKRRSNDPDKVVPANDEEAKKYLNDMVGKGIEMILSHNYPNAETQVNGLDLYYAVSCKVYDGTNYKYTYRFQSLGNGKFKLAEDPKIELW